MRLKRFASSFGESTRRRGGGEIGRISSSGDIDMSVKAAFARCDVLVPVSRSRTVIALAVFLMTSFAWRGE
jgi:hypothetical protein